MSVLLPLSLNLELLSLLLIVAGSRESAVLWGFFGVHAGASAILAPLLWRTLPTAMRQPRGPAIATLFTLNLFVPTLLLWLRLAIWVGQRWSRPRQHDAIEMVEAPEFTATRERDAPGVRAGQIRARLTSAEAPAAARLSALLSIQDAPGRITSEILRKLLADPFEDIRLLAYGMIDAKEKAISQRILAEQAALAATDEARLPAADLALRRHDAHKRLAELNWELVYQMLVQGDLRRFTARAAWDHAQAALALQPDDAGMWYLLGRIGLEADEAAEGEAAMQAAGERGFPAERLIPWLAEYAFRGRRYADVRTLFAQLATPPGAMRTAASYQYWKY
jgi:hypothetical protein